MFKKKIIETSFGHLKSEKAVDRHLFLKSNVDDSLLQTLATLQQHDDFKKLNISRLINLFILKGIQDLGEMNTENAFATISRLNAEFMEL